MSTLYVDNIYSKTGTSQALTIDSSGRVTTPARPAFHVKWSADQVATGTGYNRLNFDTELFDVGSNVSGAVFTAPVSGIYQLNLSQRFDGIGSGYVVLGLSDNASTFSAANTLWVTSYRINGTPPSNYFTLQCSLTYELTSGSVVAPWYYTTDSNYSLKVSGSQFSGYLVG
tara:strand:+ start:71 stop:583 length:513 start_codon:yes stop_codon:yes gene_type:complete